MQKEVKSNPKQPSCKKKECGPQKGYGEKRFEIQSAIIAILGRHLGFHIFFHHSLFESSTLFLQLGCFGLDMISTLIIPVFNNSYKGEYTCKPKPELEPVSNIQLSLG